MGMAKLGRWPLAAVFAVACCSAFAVAPLRAQEPGLEASQEAAQQATAQAASDCPGNPNALGTSRVLAIDPAEYPRIGRMQYPHSLPLADKEVVLTFDDGPLPPYSNQILDILASECVKATYFLVGEMARAYPTTVRRIYAEGHTIGTHSEDHPFHLGRMPVDKMRDEIDRGFANVGAALGDPDEVAPFFRIPGLDRSDALESELAAQSLAVFSSDTVADDWHHRIKPAQIISLALSRLEARGKGILLLHDIHATTVAALPGLLKELKDNGFRIVQVVPVAANHIQMASKPKTWMLASAMPEDLTIGGAEATVPVWPLSHDSVASDDIALPAPDASAFEPDAGLALDAAEVRWPDLPVAAPPPVPRSETASVHVKKRTAQREAGSSQRRHVAAAASPERERPRSQSRAERGHAHPRAHAKAGADGQHADLGGKRRTVAALLSPAPAH
jgi:peptidoglycan-N-acetylglucosamine deacetylase